MPNFSFLACLEVAEKLTESSSQLIMTGIALPPVKGDVRPPVLLHKLRLCFTGVDVAPDREQRGKPF